MFSLSLFKISKSIYLSNSHVYVMYNRHSLKLEQQILLIVLLHGLEFSHNGSMNFLSICFPKADSLWKRIVVLGNAYFQCFFSISRVCCLYLVSRRLTEHLSSAEKCQSTVFETLKPWKVRSRLVSLLLHAWTPWPINYQIWSLELGGTEIFCLVWKIQTTDFMCSEIEKKRFGRVC